MSKSWVKRGRNHNWGRNSVKRKQTKTLIVVFVLILAGLLIFNGLNSFTKLFKTFGNPISQSQMLRSKTGWDGKSKISFVTNTEPILVGTFDPIDKKLSVVSIEEATFTLVPEGFGWYQLGSVYKLGQLDNPSRGGPLLKGASEQLLLVPIDYYVDFKGNPSEINFRSLKDKVSQVSSIITPFWLMTHPDYLKNRLDTNITQKEAFMLFWKLRSVRFTEDDFYDLTRDYLDEVLLPDDSKGYLLKSGSADNFVADIFADPQIRQEDVTVGIINGTKVSGLASNASRMLEHIGVNVVKVDNNENGFESTTISVAKAIRESYTVKKLEKMFQTTAVVDDHLTSEDAVVTLGDDWGR